MTTIRTCTNRGASPCAFLDKCGASGKCYRRQLGSAAAVELRRNARRLDPPPLLSLLTLAISDDHMIHLDALCDDYRMTRSAMIERLIGVASERGE